MAWSGRYLPLFALIVLAISQPLFDIFSKNIEFFVAWNMGFLDIIYTLALIYLFIPIVSIGIVCLVRALHGPTSVGIEIVLAFISIFLFVIQQVKKFDTLGMASLLLIVGALAFILLVIYIKKSTLKTFLVYFAFFSLLLPLMFVYQLYAAGLYGGDEEYILGESNDLVRPPIVMIVFDELPLITLLDRNGLLDDVRFPAMSALAKEGVWYTKAESAGVHTTESIPALMSGTLKDETTIPNFNNYPINIFSLLGEKYDLNVTENGTRLCPGMYCEEDKTALDVKWAGIAYDVGLTYLHLISPDSMQENLPQINHKLNDFGSFVVGSGSLGGSLDMDARVATHTQFLQKIKTQNSDKPPLFFYHNLIPHYPWVFTPSGKKYTTGIATPGLSKEQWSDNEWHTVQGYQRHILQTMYADKMLGEIVAALKNKGIFDDALIIFTSDHGVGFWPGSYRRLSRKVFEGLDSKAARADFMSVPLIIKYPNSRKVGVSDTEFSGTDILPTIADIAKVKIPFLMQGKSVLDSEIVSNPADDVGATDLVDHPSLIRKIKLFGDRDINGLYMIGGLGSSVGSKLVGNEKKGPLWGQVLVANSQEYSHLDPSAAFVPLMLSGEVLRNSDADKKIVNNLVVAINDKICGSTQTYYGRKKNAVFDFFLPAECFNPGSNEVKILQETDDVEERLLLSYGGGGDAYGTLQDDVITLNNGEVLTKSKKILQGSVDAFSYSEETGLITTWGWAADIESGEPADYVLYRVGRKIYFGSDIFFSRKPLAKHFKNESLTISGFSFTISESLISGRDIEMISVMNNKVYGTISMKKFSEVISSRPGSDGASSKKVYKNSTSKTLQDAKHKVRLKSSGSGKQVLSFAGNYQIQVESNRSRMDGYLDWLTLNDDKFIFEGWASDLVENQPASSILLFQGEKLIRQVMPEYDREGVVKAYNHPLLLRSGFYLSIPQSIVQTNSGDITIIAIYEDKRAFKLHINDAYKAVLSAAITGDTNLK